jgi:hypothetical protein
VYLAYAILEGLKSRQQTRLTSEFHHKLLDRVTSAQELGILLNSEGGEKLLASLAAPKSGGANAHERILRAAQTGLVLLSLGTGLFMIGWFSPLLPLGGHAALNIFGGITASVGVGLLLSAGLSYALSKRMGLMDGEGDRSTISPVHSS